MSKTQNSKPRTKLVHAGREPAAQFGAVNPPVYHASTILFETVAEMDAAGGRTYGGPYYGRRGTPTQFKLQEAIAELEGADHCLITPSGLSACTLPLLAFLKQGDHLLITDSVYGPTRAFANKILAAKMGVEVTYYAPTIGAGIEELIQPNTQVIFLESPGSLTFEVQDVPAITAIAKAHNITTLIDNTWATPLYFNALGHGVDVVIHAATKYIVGHSDAMLGCLSFNEAHWGTLFGTYATLGLHTAPDDAFLGARGLRTLGVRLAQHEKSGLELAAWLRDRPEVREVFHPGLPGAPGHDIWKRDFTGSSGLFSFELEPEYTVPGVHAMLDHLDYFGLGFSWGGFESLAMHAKTEGNRSVQPWGEGRGHLIRINTGLEDVDDLKADLDAGFERLRGSNQ